MFGQHWAFFSILPTHLPPKNKATKVKRGLKTWRACTIGHFGQRIDKSNMYEDDFGVSLSPVSLLKRP